MTCYKPMVRWEDTSKWLKAKDGHLYHPGYIEGCKELERFDKEYIQAKWQRQIIPCGKCIGCRLDYSREWANRGYLESLCWKQNYFVTLTYDDENLPTRDECEINGITYTENNIEWNGYLVPDHLTKFMHNLRQIMQRKGIQNEGIRFIACGEYGEENRRPHYHLILFNCKLPKETFYNPRINWEQDTYFQNKIIEEAWTKGISNITECSWNTIAYVARYITKKQNGDIADEYYGLQGQTKEFFRVSRMPGIGGYYYEKNKDKIYHEDKILVKNKKGNHWVKPPEYFDKLFEKENPKAMEQIKRQRKREMKRNNKVKDTLTSLSRYEQLQIEKATKEDSTLVLKRNGIERVKKL